VITKDHLFAFSLGAAVASGLALFILHQPPDYLQLRDDRA
jgi:hypothetical protein